MILDLVLILFIIALVLALIISIVGYYRLWTNLEAYKLAFKQNLESHKATWEETIRADASKRSQAVTIGKVTEHLIPFLPDFAYNPKDARFLGSPIDFIVFDGLSEGQVNQIVFVEIKTGQSQLSRRQRRVRNAIHDGQVAWELLRANPQPKDQANDT